MPQLGCYSHFFITSVFNFFLTLICFPCYWKVIPSITPLVTTTFICSNFLAWLGNPLSMMSFGYALFLSRFSNMPPPCPLFFVPWYPTLGLPFLDACISYSNCQVKIWAWIYSSSVAHAMSIIYLYTRFHLGSSSFLKSVMCYSVFVFSDLSSHLCGRYEITGSLADVWMTEFDKSVSHQTPL